MSVTPSPIGGFAGQFFDNNGQPLSGGKIYTYAAGTTTPQATYTSALGITPHANPIILDSAGRVPGGEIWLTDGLVYKFKIDTSADILIGTYDNITGVNSNFVNYTIQEEVITATAGQTVFNLSTINYTPGTNSLSVYIDGVNQYVGDSYLETDSDTVTFTSGLHVGAEVKFTTAVQVATGTMLASDVGFTQAGTGAVAQTVQTKLEQYVSVKDFGAVGDGVTDDTAAIQAASTAAQAASVYFPSGEYKITSKITTLPYSQKWTGDGRYSTVIVKHFNGDMVDMGTACTFEDLGLSGQGSIYSGRGVVISGNGNTDQVLRNCNITDMSGYCIEIITPNAGSALDINGGYYIRTDETLCAIRLPVDTQASPRFIRGVNTTGFLVDTNGADNTILTGNRARNLIVGAASNKVNASGNRFSSLGSPLILEGTQHCFTGNTVAGDIELGVSSNGCVVTSNMFASPFGVINNSTVPGAGNIFDVAAKAYTPQWSGSGTPPSIGNGTIAGTVTRAGQSVTVNVSVLMGSTTTFGTGDWTFSLPFPSNSVPGANASNYGAAYFLDSSTAIKIGVVRNFAGASTVQLFYDDSPGAVRFNRPFTWAVGDELNFSLTYIG